jgi:hypothetical protein
MALIGRLLLLLAVLLMPLGMTPAAAAEHHMTMASAPADHCPDQESQHRHDDGLAMCSMACASALPAQNIAQDDTIVRPRDLPIPGVGHRLHGILLEIATPPPKLA